MSGVSVTGGATDVTRYFVLRLTATGVEATGLTITNFDLTYVRAGAAPAAKVDATALAATDSAHADNKAIEVDATNQPGLYRVDWPDAAFAAGVPFVILTVKCATCFTEHLCVPIDPPVNVTSIAADQQSATDLKDFADAGYDPATNKVEGVKLTDTVTTYTGNTPQTGDVFPLASTEIADIKAKTDNLPSDPADASVVAGLIAAVQTVVDAVQAKTDNLPSDPADQSAVEAAITAAVAPLALEATAQSILTDTAEIGAAGAGLTVLATAANLATVAGYLDTEIAAILTDTNELQTDWANGGRLDLLIDAIKARTDVIAVPTRTGTAQAGAAGAITLDASASAVDDFYNNQIIVITGGTGAGQARIVSDYVGSSKVASVNGNWATAPDNTSTFALLGFGAIPGATAPTAAEVRIEMDANSTKLASIETDTQDLQSRVPAALVSGRMDASVGAMAADTLTAAALATDAVTEIQSGLATTAALATVAGYLDTEIAAILEDTGTTLNDLIVAIKAKTDGLPSDPADASVVAGLIAAVQTVVDAVKLKTDNLPSDPADESLIQAAIATLQTFVDTEIAAIKAKTDNLPASPAAVGSAMTLTSGERDSIAAAHLDLADGVETGRTVRQAQRIQLAALAGKLSGAATTTATIRDTNDSKNRIVATVDADGNRTAVTLDAS